MPKWHTNIRGIPLAKCYSVAMFIVPYPTCIFAGAPATELAEAIDNTLAAAIQGLRKDLQEGREILDKGMKEGKEILDKIAGRLGAPLAVRECMCMLPLWGFRPCLTGSQVRLAAGSVQWRTAVHSIASAPHKPACSILSNSHGLPVQVRWWADPRKPCQQWALKKQTTLWTPWAFAGARGMKSPRSSKWRISQCTTTSTSLPLPLTSCSGSR